MQDAEERVRMAKERLEREARARAVHAAEVEHARQDAEARRQAEIIALELAHRERMTRVGGGRSRWAWIATGIIVVLGAVTMVSWVHADRGQGEQPSLTKTEPAKERRALRTVELEGEPAEGTRRRDEAAPAPIRAPAPRQRVVPAKPPPAEKAPRACPNSGDPLDGCL